MNHRLEPRRLVTLSPTQIERDAGARLVQDGFDEHPIAELRRAAGSVLEFPEYGFHFRPEYIADKQAECRDCSPKEAIAREPLPGFHKSTNTN